MSRDHFPAHTPEYVAEKKAQGHGMSNLNDVVQVAGWPTPNTPNGGRSLREGISTTGVTVDGIKRQVTLENVVKLSGWPTPCQQDGPHGGPNQGTDRLPGAAHLGSTVEMTSAGALNPAFPCWLMGFPIAWESCADLVTRSSRKSRPSSSKRTGKP